MVSISFARPSHCGSNLAYFWFSLSWLFDQMNLINSRVPSLVHCFDILIIHFEHWDRKKSSNSKKNSMNLIIKINPFNVGWQMNVTIYNWNVFVSVVRYFRYSNANFVINEIWDTIYLCRMKLYIPRTTCQSVSFSVLVFIRQKKE